MMRAYRATCWVSMLSVTLVLLLGGRAGTAHADDIDDAAGRPYAEAVEALETLLDSARQANELERMTRIRRSLATRHLQAADLDAALPPLESLAHQSEATVADKVIYAEVLLGIARINIQASAFGRKVHPFLRDAVDILAPLPLRAEAVPAAEIRGRLVLALTEAHWLLGEHGRALDVVTRGRQDPLPAALTPALSDFEARARYAQQDYEGAARAFLVAGNPMGAAAAFDAARKPEASLPLYAAAIAAAPEDEATLERALAAVRFHKAHAQFLDAMQRLVAPEGAAGAPFLRALAEIQEGAGRPEEALRTLTAAGERDLEDAAALVGLGRLQGLLALSGDAIDEDRLDASAQAYITAIERVPDDEGASAGLGWLAAHDYARLWSSWRKPRVAERCVRVQQALCEAAPDDAWAWANLANTLRVLGRTREALAMYVVAREANPYDPGIRSDEGLALAADGDFEAALAAYLDSVRLDPGHLAGRQNAARVHFLRGETAESLEHLGAGAATARAIGRTAGTYRYLMDRAWRAARDPALR